MYCNAQFLNGQIFEESSTYRGTLKAAARTIVASKYDLHNTEHDDDRFSNQQGWWDYLESTARDLIEQCTFLHQGEDDEVSVQTNVIVDTDSSCYRVCRTTSIIQHSKSYVYLSSTLAPKQSGAYFRMKYASHFHSTPSHWQLQRYVI